MSLPKFEFPYGEHAPTAYQRGTAKDYHGTSCWFANRISNTYANHMQCWPTCIIVFASIKLSILHSKKKNLIKKNWAPTWLCHYTALKSITFLSRLIWRYNVFKFTRDYQPDYQHDSLHFTALGLSVPKLTLDQKYKYKVWFQTSFELFFSTNIPDDL